MAELKFSNQDTAAKFEFASAEQNPAQRIHVPAGEDRRKEPGFAGAISDITPQAAERYVAQGGNLIKEKGVAPKPTAPAKETAAK